jgi:hypothetical protein
MSASVSSPLSSSTVRVRLENSPRWFELEFCLDDEWLGGPFVVNRDAGAVSVEAADDRARTYDTQTWESGIASGAFYAFRTLERPRRRIALTGLRGLLGSEDMTALATAAALGVAKLLDRQLPDVDIANWKISISMFENGKQ